MHYGGFKNYIEEDAKNRLPLLPEWCRHLDWSKSNGQIIPSPFTEITHEEWLITGICSNYGPVKTFYDGMNIPSEPEWFGGWSCNTEVKYSYGLIIAKMHFSRSSPSHIRRPIQGKGIIVDRDEYTRFMIRFFKIGCEHQWVSIPGESRMCYHVSQCSKCGQKQVIDSGD